MDKTLEPCDCNTVSALLNDPDTGVVLTPEYGFMLETKSGTGYCLYHCPFCGGKLPAPGKPIWYPTLDEAERARIQTLIAGIETGEEALARLGPPDFDAYMVHYDSGDSLNPVVVTSDVTIHDERFVLNEELSFKTRNMEYYHLSEHADIQFYFSPGPEVRVEIMLKMLPPRHVDEG